MKKFLSIISVIALMMSASPLTVSAAEGFVDSTQGNFVGETDIAYRVYSSYYVSIPTSIGADEGSGIVSVTMDNVEQGYHIEVYITNLSDTGCIPVYASDYETSGIRGALRVLHDGNMYPVDSTGLVKKFYPADYSEGTPAMTDISFDSAGEILKPGTYHGTVCFRVECVPDSTN